MAEGRNRIDSDFNPRTPHGVRPAVALMDDDIREISIHAPLTGCDLWGEWDAMMSVLFQSTHPSRGATPAPLSAGKKWAFQSTHPSRGATNQKQTASQRLWNFNPRTPHGVRQGKKLSGWTSPRFQSTHPSRGATGVHPVLKCTHLFQSTHPSRGATQGSFQEGGNLFISIHAPLTGCDYKGP